MKSRSSHFAAPAGTRDDTALATIGRTFEIEAELSQWLDQQCSLHRTSPSQMVSALLEWARDEDVLGNDPLILVPTAKPRCRPKA